MAAPYDPLVTIHTGLLAMVTDPNSRDWSARQLLVLLEVSQPGVPPQTVRGLAERLRVSKPAITRAVDALEQARFVVREPDPKDRRSVLIRTTAAGGQFLAALRRGSLGSKGLSAAA